MPAAGKIGLRLHPEDGILKKDFNRAVRCSDLGTLDPSFSVTYTDLGSGDPSHGSSTLGPTVYEAGLICDIWSSKVTLRLKIARKPYKIWFLGPKTSKYKFLELQGKVRPIQNLKPCVHVS